MANATDKRWYHDAREVAKLVGYLVKTQDYCLDGVLLVLDNPRAWNDEYEAMHAPDEPEPVYVMTQGGPKSVDYLHRFDPPAATDVD